MPIFEYKCRGCGQPFEFLILPQSPEAACPQCESRDVKKMLSVPAISSDGTKERARQSALARDRKNKDEYSRALHESPHKDHH